MTIEKKVANAILQEDIEVSIGKKTIKIPRPTLGTMIEVSRLIAECGMREFKISAESAVTDTLSIAKDCEPLAEILAVLMLGRKKSVLSVSIFGVDVIIKDRKKRLKKQILEDFTPKIIAETIAQILGQMECAFFLGIITTLSQANILKKTI